MIALIDGDIIVYECGFSSDAAARKGLLELEPDATEEELKEIREPLSFALHIVNNKIKELLEIVDTEEYEIFITGADNYRLKIMPQYKANRDPSRRPHWYKEIMQFLFKEYAAVLCNGEEADDALGYTQMLAEDHTCICSKDKDLDCIPGFHYNWSPKKTDLGVYFIEPVEALRFFYLQCLTGDATDNIPGLFKLTNRKATAKIKAGLLELDCEADMYKYVDAIYDGVDWLATAKCLWIRQEPNQLWEPPELKLEESEGE